MNKNKKWCHDVVGITLLAAGMIFTLLVMTIQYCSYKYPEVKDYSGYYIGNETEYLSYVEIKGDLKDRDISGWAIHRGFDSRNFNTKILLYQDSLEKTYSYRLTLLRNEQIPEELRSDAVDYDLSAFAVEIDSSVLPSGSYHVALYYKDAMENGECIIKTDRMLEV